LTTSDEVALLEQLNFDAPDRLSIHVENAARDIPGGDQLKLHLVDVLILAQPIGEPGTFETARKNVAFSEEGNRMAARLQAG
jgi:hypothetical protein